MHSHDETSVIINCPPVVIKAGSVRRANFDHPSPGICHYIRHTKITNPTATINSASSIENLQRQGLLVAIALAMVSSSTGLPVMCRTIAAAASLAIVSTLFAFFERIQ